MEHNALTSLTQAPPPASIVTMCAWCLVEQGIALGNGSHGICQRHAIEVRAAYRKRRQQRREVQA